MSLHAADIGGRGEESEEAILGDEVSGIVVTFDADAIHRHRAVDQAAAVPFRDDDQIFAARVLAEFRGERAVAALDRLRAHLAEDAESGLRKRAQEILSIAGLEDVAAKSEEDEVSVIEPAEERARFVDFLARHRQRRTFELVDIVGERLAHRPPVAHGEAHFAQDVLDRGADRFQLGGLGLLVDLDVHVGLDRRIARRALGIGHFEPVAVRVATRADHRVQEEMDLALAAVDLRAHGVDEERHVVVDDLEDRVLESPTIRLGGRIEETYLRRARRALRAELPQRQSAAEERVEGGVDDVVGSDVREIASDKMLCALSLIGRNATASLRRQPVDEIDLALFCCDGHAFSNRRTARRVNITKRCCQLSVVGCPCGPSSDGPEPKTDNRQPERHAAPHPRNRNRNPSSLVSSRGRTVRSIESSSTFGRLRGAGWTR